jgi:hypothetical protein
MTAPDALRDARATTIRTMLDYGQDIPWSFAGPLLEEMAADEDVELHVTLSGIFHVRVIFPLGPADAYYDRFDPEAVARAWLAWQEARACEKP